MFVSHIQLALVGFRVGRPLALVNACCDVAMVVALDDEVAKPEREAVVLGVRVHRRTVRRSILSSRSLRVVVPLFLPLLSVSLLFIAIIIAFWCCRLNCVLIFSF